MSVESQLYEIRLNSSQFASKLDQIESKLNGFESKLGGVGNTIKGVFGGTLMAQAFTRALDLVKDASFAVVKLGVDFEQTTVSFETMLGSADRAAKTLKELEEFAKITPFRFEEVVTGSKQLIAYGFQAETLTKDLTILGDVASGLSIPLGDLIYLYGTLKTQGKVMTKDLMQFAMRGIPIYDELSKVLGVTKKELGEIVTDGKVTFEQVEQAFKNMTAEGSKFGGLMAKQSKTLGGRWSTFLDKVEASGRSLGTKLIPYLGEALDKVNEFVDSKFISLINEFSDSLITAFEYIKTVDFSQWTDPLSEIYDSLKGIYTSLSELFNFDAVGSTFLGALRQLVKDTLLITESLASVIEYTTAKAEAAFSKRSGPTLSSDEYKEWRKTHSENDPLPTFEDALKTKLQKAKDIWERDLSKATSNKIDKAGEESKAGGKKTNLGTSESAKASSVGVEKVASSTRNINIKIDNLVKEITFSKTQGWKESEGELVERVKRALLTAVNDVNIIGQ